MKRLLILLMIIWSTQISAYDQLHLKRFLALNKCPGCDLSGLNFTGRNLDFADLSGANLRNVNFTGAYIGTFGANFRGAIFIGANFKSFRAGRADFTDADLTETNPEEGNFSTAIFCRTKTPWGTENIGC